MKKNYEWQRVYDLNDAQKSAWIAALKKWELETPCDKAARNPPAFGILSGVVACFMLILSGDLSLSPLPLFAIPFGYAMYYITNKRFQKWDTKRRLYSDKIVSELTAQGQEKPQG